VGRLPGRGRLDRPGGSFRAAVAGAGSRAGRAPGFAGRARSTRRRRSCARLRGAGGRPRAAASRRSAAVPCGFLATARSLPSGERSPAAACCLVPRTRPASSAFRIGRAGRSLLRAPALRHRALFAARHWRGNGPHHLRLRRTEPAARSRPVRVTIAGASALRAVVPPRPPWSSAGCPRAPSPLLPPDQRPARRRPPRRRRRSRADGQWPPRPEWPRQPRRGSPAIGRVRRCGASVSRVLGRSTLRVLRALRPRWREVTALRARAPRSGTDAHRVATLKRRTPWTFQPSSPSGVASSRRVSSHPPSCPRNHHDVASGAASGHARSRPTESGRAPVKNVWIVERPVAAEDAPRKLRKAAAGAVRIARDWKATSFVLGAAKTGTSSAPGSAGTPSTRRPWTSSRPGPTRRTARAIWTLACRPGTPARRGNLPPPTGRRCPIRSPGPSRAGAGRRTTAACTAGTDPRFTRRRARRLRSPRPTHLPR